MTKYIRLDKFLSDMGIGTRNKVKTIIRNGKVLVNGLRCEKPNIKIDINSDKVVYNDSHIVYIEYLYYMLNKPIGVISATKDNKSKTVLDLIDDKDRMGKELFPIGRLDKDACGLLLMTNDGELAHKLLSPRKHVEKTYFVKVLGRVTKEDILAFSKGVNIGEKCITLPAKLTILISDNISHVKLTIMEGKFHQIKRMFASVEKEVIYLKRISMGSLNLDNNLSPGEYRLLTDEEIKILRQQKQKGIR